VQPRSIRVSCNISSRAPRDHVRITHYLYNAFLIEHGDARVAIDPGQNLWLFKLESLIPKSEWSSITHLLITHGDPDHHRQSDRVAQASGAHVVCGKGLTREIPGQRLVVDPRGRALTSWVHFENLYPLEAGESVTLDGVRVEAVKTEHGPISIPIFGFRLRCQPGPEERVGTRVSR
jgi:glyoxylase-like metal-dependent hydrolase (beta-lactamase superfamily II)